MQSPNIPETPGVEPIAPEQTPVDPQPDIPEQAPNSQPPEESPNPGSPEYPGTRPPVDPGIEQAALEVRIP
jgi:hypothetical protein